jgi:hypothetical protein
VTSRNKLFSAFDKSADQPSAAAPPAATKQEAKKDAKHSRIGFGMQIDSKNDALTVTKTESRGNAAEAGIRKGDVIVAAGGVEIKSVEELEEITRILGNGDQLEFEIARRGQKNKVLVQFGEAPEEAEAIVSKQETPARKVSNFNFVPEPVDNTGALRSVLNDPPANVQNSAGGQINRIPKTGTQFDAAKQMNRLNPQSIVEQQRLQIEKLKREVERLRQQTDSKLNSQSNDWNSPSLSGPEK